LVQQEEMSMDIRESYDSAAGAYAERLAAELNHKPLDRHLLNRFAEEVQGRGLVADLGCGPGQVARYLHDRGVSMLGIDLSERMVEAARRLHPGLDFRVGDLTRLELPDASLAGAVAFYAIVHFEPSALPAVMPELRRVLAVGAPLLVSFHAGEGIVHLDELFGARVNLDFHFHDPGAVREALRRAGFRVTEHAEREPYEGVEYPSRRCYLLARAC
jgi:SAM-dependent methyltransferase